MSDHEDLKARYEAIAAKDLTALADEAAQSLDLDTREAEQLGLLLARAWMAGATAGQDEMIRQADSQGFKINTEVVLRSPDASAD
ncbi:MAG: hypothetical protein ACLQMH_15740 [Solirubrobacteraceae bacterium]